MRAWILIGLASLLPVTALGAFGFMLYTFGGWGLVIAAAVFYLLVGVIAYHAPDNYPGPLGGH